jgi:hypothetical protein
MDRRLTLALCGAMRAAVINIPTYSSLRATGRCDSDSVADYEGKAVNPRDRR